MRAVHLMVALLGVTVATPAFSQWYAGFSAGSSSFSPKKSDWEAAGSSTSFDERDGAWKVFGGYGFHPNVALEFGYADLGNYTATIVPAVAADTGTANVKVKSWNMFVVGKAPISGAFALTGKVGLSHNRTDMSFNSSGGTFLASDSGKNRQTELAYGVGMAYAINPRVGLRAEYEGFGKAGNTNNGFTTPGNTSESKPSLLSVGVQVSF